PATSNLLSQSYFSSHQAGALVAGDEFDYGAGSGFYYPFGFGSLRGGIGGPAVGGGGLIGAALQLPDVQAGLALLQRCALRQEDLRDHAADHFPLQSLLGD